MNTRTCNIKIKLGTIYMCILTRYSTIKLYQIVTEKKNKHRVMCRNLDFSLQTLFIYMYVIYYHGTRMSKGSMR